MKFSDPSIHNVTKIEATSARHYHIIDVRAGFAYIQLTFTGTDEGPPATMFIYLPYEQAVYAARIAQAINQINAADADAALAEAEVSDEIPF